MPRQARGWAWGAASLLLGVVSLVCFSLYGKWHWDVWRALREGQETDRFGWNMIGELKIASSVAAVAALVLAVVALGRGPKWLAWAAVVVAALACVMIPVQT